MGWYECNGCVCGTPQDLARMNRSISFYTCRDVPTGELEQTIGWLDDIRADCEFKISQLQSLERSRKRAENWRHDMNGLARQFYDPDNTHLDLETRIQIVQQRLDVDPDRARHIAGLVHSWAKRQQRKDRNEFICMDYSNDVSVTELAKKYKLSRQHIYNILENDPEKRFLR